MPAAPSRSFISAAALLLVAGCASPGGGAGANQERRGSILPAALTSRWSAPDAATRVVDVERGAALSACVNVANAMGYSVSRVDGASGRILANRAPAASFEGARQVNLEIRLTTLSPGATQVALMLREAVESAGDDRVGPMVTTAMVRERAPYDAFFARLGAELTPPAAR